MMVFASRFSRLRRLLFGALLLLAAASVRAEEPPAEPQQLLIEKISVEGARPAAARIIKAETLLREGRAYTEDELRQAVYRINRLPFVLGATFALRKGSERGAYELVIQAEPARWFFFDHSIRPYFFNQPTDIDGFIGNGESFILSLPGLIGARLFTGRSGVLFASLDTEEGVHAGYTHYNLFGRGVVAGASYSTNALCCAREAVPYGLDPGFTTWGWDDSDKVSLFAAVPLRTSQSLQMGWSRTSGDGSTRQEILQDFSFRFFVNTTAGGSDLTYDRAELRWVLDTSDDPQLPTHGLTLTAGIERSTLESERLLWLRFQDDPPGFTEEELPPFESEYIAASFSATRHWSLTPRQTVSGTGRLSIGTSTIHNLPTVDGPRADIDLDVYGASAGLQHAVSLWRSRGERGFGDLRLETGAELGFEATSPDLGLGNAPSPLERLEVWTGLVFRNQWGRLRFNLTYLDLGEVLP